MRNVGAWSGTIVIVVDGLGDVRIGVGVGVAGGRGHDVNGNRGGVGVGKRHLEKLTGVKTINKNKGKE